MIPYIWKEAKEELARGERYQARLAKEWPEKWAAAKLLLYREAGSNLHMLTSVKLFVDASEQLLCAAAAAATRQVEGL